MSDVWILTMWIEQKKAKLENRRVELDDEEIQGMN